MKYYPCEVLRPDEYGNLEWRPLNLVYADHLERAYRHFDDAFLAWHRNGTFLPEWAFSLSDSPSKESCEYLDALRIRLFAIDGETILADYELRAVTDRKSSAD